MPELGRDGLGGEPGRDLGAGVEHVSELIRSEVLELRPGLDQGQRAPHLGPLIVGPVTGRQHRDRGARQAWVQAARPAGPRAAGAARAARPAGPPVRPVRRGWPRPRLDWPGSSHRPSGESRRRRRRRSRRQPAPVPAAGRVAGWAPPPRQYRPAPGRLRTVPRGERDRNHERPGRKAPGRGEHGPDQRLGLPDHLGRPGHHRQDQQPRPELAGQMPELADLPPADRRPGRERQHRPVAELRPASSGEIIRRRNEPCSTGGARRPARPAEPVRRPPPSGSAR